ncbi:serine esterase, putative [Plasmodium sp. gorilla clade G2]|uniref:serine esterase, putative n=1 Tax=Plasmodium sp. gorilla clade G2 TaxID=880535 RepID=UPI000D206F4F|nr:serine esterase, putative [Plasmodium sp. gorilla clade G2]SOV15535.1 serine esterase, putative [Plasmodium sp. gorilla clade G2]
MREKNLNFRSESIFSGSRSFFDILENVDDEKEAKRSAHFFNSNKNVLLNLFKGTNQNNNVNNILLEKKRLVSNPRNNKCVNKECKNNELCKIELKDEFKKNEEIINNECNCSKKNDWIKNFCWFCSLHILNEILEKQIYKEKIHEHVYDLIYDEDTYFDTSSMMSIPYEFARFMITQLDYNTLHEIKLNNIIKEEKYLFKKYSKKSAHNSKKYDEYEEEEIYKSDQSNSTCSLISDDTTLNINMKNTNLDYSNYLNMRKELYNNNNNNDNNDNYDNNNKNNVGDTQVTIKRTRRTKKTFYDSNNVGNSGSTDLFNFKKVLSSSESMLNKNDEYYMDENKRDHNNMENNINYSKNYSNNNKYVEQLYLGKYTNKKQLTNDSNKINNKNDDLFSENVMYEENKKNNFLSRRRNNSTLPTYHRPYKKNASHSSYSSIPFWKSKRLSDSIVYSKYFNELHMNNKIKKKKNKKKENSLNNKVYRNYLLNYNIYNSFNNQIENKTVPSQIINRYSSGRYFENSRMEYEGRNNDKSFMSYGALKRCSSCTILLREKKEKKKNKKMKNEYDEEMKIYLNEEEINNDDNNDIFYDNKYKEEYISKDKKIYNKYKNNLNHIKQFYCLNETEKKPFPICLYNNVKSFEYIKQCYRCCCFFNTKCCHCTECKEKYHMKLKNPHYFIFQHGLTASVHDFQNIFNSLLTKYPHVFVYITYSNQGHTFEGVDVGTERICTELNCLFKIINDKINISMIGHSLGGILNRSVLLNLNRKKIFKNKKLINFITFACPHIGVHENMAIMKVLSTYLGAHTIDDLNNKTTLLLKIASVESINILKKFENIIFYGNTQSDWLVGIRTSLILPYTLFNEELILFIIEQAKNVPEIPINIFSVVHLYMRKKKLLFFYFYQDLKNPNYLLNKRKEQSKFLDQMLQTIISSRKLLSSTNTKKFNLFSNYYSNVGVDKFKGVHNEFNKNINNDKNVYSDGTNNIVEKKDKKEDGQQGCYSNVGNNNHMDNTNDSDITNNNNNNNNNSNSNNNIVQSVIIYDNNKCENNSNYLLYTPPYVNKRNVENNLNLKGHIFPHDINTQMMPIHFRKNISSTKKQGKNKKIDQIERNILHDKMYMQHIDGFNENKKDINDKYEQGSYYKSHTYHDMFIEKMKENKNMSTLVCRSDMNNTDNTDNIDNIDNKMEYGKNDTRENKKENEHTHHNIIDVCNGNNSHMCNTSNCDEPLLYDKIEKTKSFECMYMDKNEKEHIINENKSMIHNNDNYTFTVSENSNCSNKNSISSKDDIYNNNNNIKCDKITYTCGTLISNHEDKINICDDKTKNINIKNDINIKDATNKQVINKNVINYKMNENKIENNITLVNNKNKLVVHKNNIYMTNINSIDEKRTKFGEYKDFEKLFFDCLKSKIINDIKTLDNNLKKKKKKKIETNKLFSIQNTINMIKNYSFLYPSKNSNNEDKKKKNSKSSTETNGSANNNIENKKDIHMNNKLEDESLVMKNYNVEEKNSWGKEKFKKLMDTYFNEKLLKDTKGSDKINESNNINQHEQTYIPFDDDQNEEYDYISEFFHSSSEENDIYPPNNLLSCKQHESKKKNKNYIIDENSKYVEFKSNKKKEEYIKRNKLKRNDLLKGITKYDKKQYKQILFYIYTISSDELLEKFFKNPELLYYEVLFYCLNRLPIQRYSIAIPIYSNAHVQIIAHPRICSEESAIVKHFVEHLIL